MTSHATTASALPELPLPPGSPGLPVVGETLAFLRDPFTFVTVRAAKYGPIFRTNLLGHPTVILVGGETAGAFIDPDRVEREGAMPPHIQELFGGRSLPLLDGAEHRARKTQVLAGFLPPVLPSYLSAMQASVESALASFAGREIQGIVALKRLAMTVIARNVASMDPGASLDGLLEHFATLTAGFSGLPIRVPGTAYAKAHRARDAIFEILRGLVAEHRARPHDDGLSRMLAQKDDAGHLLSDEHAAMELHHVFIAGYIVFAELATMLIELGRRPDLAARLRQEIAEHAPSGAVSPTALAALPLLLQVVLETKRCTPVVPVVFGRAKKTFALSGWRIPAGTRVHWAAHAHHQDAKVYPEPEAFDPDRFSRHRAENERHAFAFAPQGMGPALSHKCPGTDYATVFMQLFGVVALRDYTWSLPEQDLTLDGHLIPPEPKSGLRIVFQRRPSA